MRQITGNAGLEGAIIIEKIRANKDANYGLNAQTEVYEDLVKAGVIDPPFMFQFSRVLISPL